MKTGNSASSPASPGIRWRNYAALALGVFGLSQLAGDLLGSRVLRGLGAISVVAPFPKVFCAQNGCEGFAAEFVLHAQTKTRGMVTVPLTPERYSRLAGPYNRRNVLGAALAGAPLLPEPVWQSVFCHGFGPGGSLASELGLPDDTTHVVVVARTKTRGTPMTWTLSLPDNTGEPDSGRLASIHRTVPR
jgi:hypothetical protein